MSVIGKHSENFKNGDIFRSPVIYDAWPWRRSDAPDAGHRDPRHPRLHPAPLSSSAVTVRLQDALSESGDSEIVFLVINWLMPGRDDAMSWNNYHRLDSIYSYMDRSAITETRDA